MLNLEDLVTTFFGALIGALSAIWISSWTRRQERIEMFRRELHILKRDLEPTAAYHREALRRLDEATFLIEGYVSLDSHAAILQEIEQFKKIPPDVFDLSLDGYAAKAFEFGIQPDTYLVDMLNRLSSMIRGNGLFPVI